MSFFFFGCFRLYISVEETHRLFKELRFIINDTFRSSLCLIHPPHLIALASIYLALSMNPPRSLISAFTSLNNNPSTSAASTSSSSLEAPPNMAGVASRTRRRGSTDTSNNPQSSNLSSSTSKPPSSSTATSTTTSNNGKPGGQTDPLTFLASLDIDQTILLEIIQEIISLYELWSILESPSEKNGNSQTTPPPSSPTTGNASGRGTKLEGNSVDQKLVGLIKRMQDSRMRELREERSKAAQVSSGGNGGTSSSVGGGVAGKRG